MYPLHTSHPQTSSYPVTDALPMLALETPKRFWDCTFARSERELQSFDALNYLQCNSTEVFAGSNGIGSLHISYYYFINENI